MPDKLTDNEIVKALKLLLELVLVEGCLQRAKTISNALDLINRLQEENERLKEEIKKEQLYNLRMTAHSVKAEAYKEFAERLKRRFLNKNEVINNTIDNLLKELVGDDNA